MIVFRVLEFVSNLANFGITEINNRFKRLEGRGCDDLKVRTLRKRGCLNNVQKRTKGEGAS